LATRFLMDQPSKTRPIDGFAAVLVALMAVGCGTGGTSIPTSPAPRAIRATFSEVQSAAGRRDAQGFCNATLIVPGGPPPHLPRGELGAGTARAIASVTRSEQQCARTTTPLDLQGWARQLNEFVIAHIDVRRPYLATVGLKIRDTERPARGLLYFAIVAGRWRFVIFSS